MPELKPELEMLVPVADALDGIVGLAGNEPPHVWMKLAVCGKPPLASVLVNVTFCMAVRFTTFDPFGGLPLVPGKNPLTLP